jgi:hygromycin-B 4-O-kinase
MESLLNSCPQERYLVHGDYGFGNLLAANGQVTAVLDWLNARYGDFLYDVAWLDFWDSGRGYRDRFRARYAEQDIDIPNYESRLLCYQCCIALDGLRFFAKANNAAAYQWVKDHILRLIPSD